MRINDRITIPDAEIELTFVRAQGAGGQNVNKVASAVHLRFDLNSDALPEAVRRRLLAGGDSRITNEGVVVIKAQSRRTQEGNRREALDRLREMILAATKVPRRRIPTRPGAAAKKKRVDAKKRRGALKKLRSERPD